MYFNASIQLNADLITSLQISKGLTTITRPSAVTIDTVSEKSVKDNFKLLDCINSIN